MAEFSRRAYFPILIYFGSQSFERHLTHALFGTLPENLKTEIQGCGRSAVYNLFDHQVVYSAWDIKLLQSISIRTSDLNVLFLSSYSSCCWISLTNGGNGNWFLSTTVNLTRRQDIYGKINSSPISALSPIVRLQQGCPRTISIPAEDSDGDKVRCRWSTGQNRECGGVCHIFNSGTLDEVSSSFMALPLIYM